MKQPEKWKETIDPFSLNFKNFKLTKILGYPHARNDVFYCKGYINDKDIYSFIKYASKSDSNILNEAETINMLNFNFLPEIIEYDKSGKYIITKEVLGERLSTILQLNKSEKAIDYMFEYGKTLALIHSSNNKFSEIKHRKFFDIPSEEYFKENNIEFVGEYLRKNKPSTINKCFCHGDFHYANILWENKKIVAVLDWELSGIGNKEFDIAWSIINRPSQKFLKTKKEVNEFLKGYKSILKFNKEYVKYYMCLIYYHFLNVDKTNIPYKNYVTKWLSKNINPHLTSDNFVNN